MQSTVIKSFFQNLFSQLLIRMFTPIYKFFRSLFMSNFFRGLCAGLIPTCLLIYFVVEGLNQTQDQLGILREQLSYSREPILWLREELDQGSGVVSQTLKIGNVGNETAENVNIRMFLFLLTADHVYSYGQHENTRSYFTDTTRTTRGMIWPRLRLEPNDDVSLSSWLTRLKVRPFHTIPEAEDFRSELINIQNILKGIYIVFVEYSCRRKSDLSLRTDTAYFRLYPIWERYSNLDQEIGGPKMIRRIKDYLHNGPQLSINILADRYEIYQHEIGDFPPTILTIPRER